MHWRAVLYSGILALVVAFVVVTSYPNIPILELVILLCATGLMIDLWLRLK